jgi:DNA-binding response OmpR family regulator
MSLTDIPPLRVLVVDDDVLLLQLIHAALGDAGFHVQTAVDGVIASEKLRADGPPFDLLLTDHNMPGMNGLDLVREIRFSGRAATSIVICSGNVPPSVFGEYRDLGVHSIIPKPFALADLVAGVRGAIVAHSGAQLD